MRLWSISPEYLDTKGLIALWREGLLAKAVLENKTKGYKNHPQLIRFKEFKDPLLAINSYLYYVFLESKKRFYTFNVSKIEIKILEKIIPVSKGQIEYEFVYLLKKIMKRDFLLYERLSKIDVNSVMLNPIFYPVEGPIESWEKFNNVF